MDHLGECEMRYRFFFGTFFWNNKSEALFMKSFIIFFQLTKGQKAKQQLPYRVRARPDDETLYFNC